MVVGEALLQVDLYESDQVDEVLPSLGVRVLATQRLVPLGCALAERSHNLAPIVQRYCSSYWSSYCRFVVYTQF